MLKHLLFVLFLFFFLSGCNNKIKDDITPSSNKSIHLHAEDIQFAERVRNIILQYHEEARDKNISEYFKSIIKSNEKISADTAFANKLLSKIEDKGFIEKIKYISDLKSNFQKIESHHFKFYYKGNAPDDTIIVKWDRHFNRLSKTFDNSIDEKLIIKIDPEEKWGRCFPPWDIQWSIRQDDVEDNPHELAHIFLFKFSDVPFFHEPLAFIYGTHHGSFEKASDRKERYKKILVENGFISSTELLHFPQIIGLDDNKWASAYFFISELVEKYGLHKILELMPKATWNDEVVDYKIAFKKVYGISLGEFENTIRSKLKKAAI